MSSPFIIIFIFPTILNNQGLLLRNETKAKAEVFQKFRLFLALDLFASKCKINITKKDHCYQIFE